MSTPKSAKKLPLVTRIPGKYPEEITDGQHVVRIVCLDVLLLDPYGVLLPKKGAEKIADILILLDAYDDYAGANDTPDKDKQTGEVKYDPKTEACIRLIEVFNIILKGLDSNGFYTCENGMKIYVDKHIPYDPLNKSVHYTDKLALACARNCPGIPLLTNNKRIENKVLRDGKLTVCNFVRDTYTGRRDVKLSTRSKAFKKWCEKGYITLADFQKACPGQPKLRINEFVEWKLPKSITKSADYRFWDYIGRFRFIEGQDGKTGEWVIQSIAESATAIPFFRPKHPGQAMLLDLCMDRKIQRILCLGAAGSGKTATVTAYATYSIFACPKGTNARFHNFLTIVPEVGLGKDYGALPGNLDEKMIHKLHPLVKNLRDILMAKAKKEGKPISYSEATKAAIAIITNPNLVEIIPMIDMMGITEKDSMFVGDEFQEHSSLQIRSALTRGGEGCLTILFGDIDQSTRSEAHSHINDFAYIFHKLGYDIDNNPTVGLLMFKKDEQARDEALVALLNALA